MGTCDVCENEYEHSFQVIFAGKTYTFDSFECAIHLLAPTCSHCSCRIIGHGIQTDDGMFCCASCARMHGIKGAIDNVHEHAKPLPS
jgi:hypothetical protein